MTINTVDTNVTVNSPVLSANTNADAYQWIDCDLMQSISGATQQSFTATQNGNYAVIITQNSYVDTSFCHAITGIGIKDIDVEDVLKVYPNPSKGEFRIELRKNHERISYQVLDARAQLIEEGEKQNIQSFKVDFKTRTPGVYFLRINDEVGRIFTVRLVLL